MLRSQPGAEVGLAEFQECEIPVYDGDAEKDRGVPAGARALGQRISDARAMVFSAPEYNGGISGAFKNAIDWVSRLDPVPWSAKPILLIGASPGAMRGLWHTRAPLEAVGSIVYPRMFGLPRAHQAFDLATGRIQDEKSRGELSALLESYVRFAQKLEPIS